MDTNVYDMGAYNDSNGELCYKEWLVYGDKERV